MAFLTYLDKYWRIIGTGIAFAIFGIGSIILGNIYMLFIRIIYKDRIKRRILSQKGIQICFAFFVKSLKLLKIIDYKIEGAEILQQDKGCLIVANHPSLLDYVLIGSVLPTMDCVVKEALFRNPFCKMVVKNANYIPNSSDPEKLLSDCKDRLDHGGKLLIFPEGTRTALNNEQLKLQRGAAQIAVRIAAPLRVVKIICEPRSLTKEMAWYQVPNKRSFFHIKVEEMIDIAPYIKPDLPPSKAVRHLTKELSLKLQPTKDDIETTRSL